jgi:alpha-tubulin suppressor-like RCC1 family protein
MQARDDEEEEQVNELFSLQTDFCTLGACESLEPYSAFDILCEHYCSDVPLLKPPFEMDGDPKDFTIRPEPFADAFAPHVNYSVSKNLQRHLIDEMNRLATMCQNRKFHSKLVKRVSVCAKILESVHDKVIMKEERMKYAENCIVEFRDSNNELPVSSRAALKCSISLLVIYIDSLKDKNHEAVKTILQKISEILYGIKVSALPHPLDFYKDTVELLQPLNEFLLASLKPLNFSIDQNSPIFTMRSSLSKDLNGTSIMPLALTLLFQLSSVRGSISKVFDIVLYLLKCELYCKESVEEFKPFFDHMFLISRSSTPARPNNREKVELKSFLKCAEFIISNLNLKLIAGRSNLPERDINPEICMVILDGFEVISNVVIVGSFINSIFCNQNRRMDDLDDFELQKFMTSLIELLESLLLLFKKYGITLHSLNPMKEVQEKMSSLRIFLMGVFESPLFDTLKERISNIFVIGFNCFFHSKQEKLGFITSLLSANALKNQCHMFPTYFFASLSSFDGFSHAFFDMNNNDLLFDIGSVILDFLALRFEELHQGRRTNGPYNTYIRLQHLLKLIIRSLSSSFHFSLRSNSNIIGSVSEIFANFSVKFIAFCNKVYSYLHEYLFRSENQKQQLQNLDYECDMISSLLVEFLSYLSSLSFKNPLYDAKSDHTSCASNYYIVLYSSKLIGSLTELLNTIVSIRNRVSTKDYTSTCIDKCYMIGNPKSLSSYCKPILSADYVEYKFSFSMKSSVSLHLKELKEGILKIGSPNAEISIESNGKVYMMRTVPSLLNFECSELNVRIPIHLISLKSFTHQYTLDLNVKSFQRPFQWIYDLSLQLIWICGDFGSNVLNGFPELSCEVFSKGVLESRIIHGGFELRNPLSEKVLPEFNFISSFDEFQMKSQDDQPYEDHEEFLKDLINDRGSASTLINALQLPVRNIIQIPKSIEKITSAVTRMVFACLVKHSCCTEDAISNCRTLARCSEKAHERLDEYLVELWRRASEMRGWIATKFGQGYQVTDLCNQALEKSEFLLSLSSCSSFMSTLLLSRHASSSLSASHAYVKKKQIPASIRKKSFQSELSLNRAYSHVSNKSVITRDPQTLLMKALLDFFQSDQRDLVEHAKNSIIAQQTRARLRIYSISVFLKLFESIKHLDLRLEMLTHLVNVHRRAFINLEPCYRIHILQGAECVEANLKELLLKNYYNLLGSLIRHKNICDDEKLLVVCLFALDYEVSDLSFINSIELLEFISPILAFDELSTSNATEKSIVVNSNRLDIRYASWCLFRLLAYTCAGFFNNDSSYSIMDFHQSLLEDSLLQMKKCISLRNCSIESKFSDNHSIRDLSVDEKGWECKLCTLWNDIESKECLACQAPMRGFEGNAKWSCPGCTFINEGSSLTCFICDIQRPSDETSSDEKLVDSSLSFAQFWDNSLDCQHLAFSGPEVSEPSTVTSSLGISSWVVVRSKQKFDCGSVEVSVRIDSDNVSSPSSHRYLLGFISSEVSNEDCLNPQSSNFPFWAYSGSNGLKISRLNGSLHTSSYASSFSQGDVVRLSANLDDGTVEFFKNGISQGVAFSSIFGPIQICAWIGVPNISLTFVHHSEYSKVDLNWNEILQISSLTSSSNQWFISEMDHIGVKGKHLARKEFPHVIEVDTYLNQHLWLLLRDDSGDITNKVLARKEWLRILLSLALNIEMQESVLWSTQILGIRLCRHVLINLRPREVSLILRSGNNSSNNLSIEKILMRLFESIGQISFNFEDGKISAEKNCDPFSPSIASELVCLIRTLLLSPTWVTLIGNQIFLILQELGSNLKEILEREIPYENSPEIFRIIGVFSVLGGFLEPMREGARVVFLRDGRAEEGCITNMKRSLDTNSFSLGIRSDADPDFIIQCPSIIDAEKIDLQVISEVEFLPESLLSFPQIYIIVAKVLNRFHFVNSWSKNVSFVSFIKFQASRILGKCFQVIEVIEIYQQNNLLKNIIEQAMCPTSYPNCLRIDNVESNLQYLYDRLISTAPKQYWISYEDLHNKLSRMNSGEKESLLGSSVLFSFGKGDNGRLGLGNNCSCSVPSPVIVPGIRENVKFNSVSCFSSHVVAVSSEGVVYTWGKGDDGRLGHGSRNSINAPKSVDGLKHKRCIYASAGLNFTVVLDHEGFLWSFGSNAHGQLGTGNFITSLVPVQVVGDLKNTRVEYMSAGGSHALAISNGIVYSWGKNQYGQLGRGDTNKSSLPIRMEKTCFNDSSVKMVAGGWEHSMALTEYGILYTWGAGYEGTRPVCGHGSCEKELYPRKVTTLEQEVIVFISTGWDHSIAIDNQGFVYTWGSGTSGVLGHGTTTAQLFPKRIESLARNLRCVYGAGGQDHTVLLMDNGDLFCFGVLGNHLGTSLSGQYLVPTRLPSLSGKHKFSLLACGDKCTFALASEYPVFLSVSPQVPKLLEFDRGYQAFSRFKHAKCLDRNRTFVLYPKHAFALVAPKPALSQYSEKFFVRFCT